MLSVVCYSFCYYCFSCGLTLPRWIAVLRGAFLVVRMLILEIFKFFPSASALVMPPVSRKDVRLSQPVAGPAGAEREEGEEDGELDAHLVTPHVSSARATTGDRALNASQQDWSSHRVSWWLIWMPSGGWWF